MTCPASLKGRGQNWELSALSCTLWNIAWSNLTWLSHCSRDLPVENVPVAGQLSENWEKLGRGIEEREESKASMLGVIGS